MNTDFIKMKAELTLSQSFGEQYNEILNTNEVFNNPSAHSVSELYKSILLENDLLLSSFQKKMIDRLFVVFEEIQKTIDPNRLKSFDFFFNSVDNELFFSRKSDEGYTNLVIHDSEDIAYSYIDKIKGDELSFYNEDSDFEMIALKFFSH
jgi:hypothetical protein